MGVKINICSLTDTQHPVKETALKSPKGTSDQSLIYSKINPFCTTEAKFEAWAPLLSLILVSCSDRYLPDMINAELERTVSQHKDRRTQRGS